MDIESPRLKRRIYCGVFLISLSILMLQLVLTRIFSVTMYYHFAFMAISLALFGSGASGVFAYLKSPRFTPERAPSQMAFCSMAMAGAIVVSLFALLKVTVGLVPSYRAYLTLAWLYLVCAAPFFFGGMCLSLAMKHFAASSGKLYFFDLIGASAGCLLVIPAINAMGGPTAMLLVAAIAAVSAVVFSYSPRTARSRFLLRSSFVLTAVMIGLVYVNWRWQPLDVVWAKGSREKPALFAKWNSFSRVTVTGDLNAEKPLWITIDSDAATPVLRFSSNPDSMQYVERAVSALAYHIKERPKVLIIGPGGGREVVTALEAGSRDITGVEVNPIIVNDVMLAEPYKSFSGNLYDRPEVTVFVDEGRSFIHGSDAKYDIIQASLIDTWAANSAGAFALAENNLYTIEAFNLYLDHLTDNGMLTMTRWLLNPPQQELRLVSLAREVLRERGARRPELHFCLFKAPGRGERVETSFIFKKSEFTETEVRKLEQIAASNGCEILYTPLTRPMNVFTELVTTSDPEAFYRTYSINVRPTYDNSPFFFYHVMPGDIWKAFRLTSESQKTNMGVFVLFSLLIITTVLVGVFMIGPLWLVRRRDGEARSRPRLRFVSYFGLLGLGFIVIEMVMVQRFILLLGYPVYALAIVLFSLLFWSGVGSLMTSRIPDGRIDRWVKIALGAIVLLTVIYVELLPELFKRFGGAPIGWRITLAVFFLAPIACVLGMPMPLGIRLLNKRAPDIVPWAWGINGATSVLGSVLAVILAMNLGFSEALVFGSVVYLLAIVVIALWARTPAPAEIKIIKEVEPVSVQAGD